ncbi:MAG TPA: hypothetical protein VKU19_38765 [Bryobacteraceae bacterium]|nr:hypothetical protein [Bryobacteraceae bacterium]
MAAGFEDLLKENPDDVLIQMIQDSRLSDLTLAIEAHEDPIAMGSAFASAVRRLYREYSDVSNMLVAGGTGLTYCLSKASRESDHLRARELKKLGRVIAFNTAVNCWPGWGDDGIVIEEAHISAGIQIATECLSLVQELALTPREQGGAHWLIGALQLAAGRFGVARMEFEEARQIYLRDESISSYALMADGYIALAAKADPQSGPDGVDALSMALDRLRSEGSKDATFFAAQIATADRVLLKN